MSADNRIDDTPDTEDAFKAVTGGAEGELADAGIVFVDGADFMAQKLPPPKWIVRDFIAVGMKGDLCGKSKTKKTYLGLQLALHIATGKDFALAYHIDAPHVVAYINLELFDWNFQERMSAQMSQPKTSDQMPWDEKNISDACGGLGIDREALRGKLLICNLRGNAAALRDKTDALVAYLESKGVELAIIDPRYKLLKQDEDENTGHGLQGILEMRDRLADHFAVMIVTHDPKGDTQQKATTDRGAGSYRAGADFDFRLTIDLAQEWSEDNPAFVLEAEGRARKAPPKLGLKFDESGQLFRLDPDASREKFDHRLQTRVNADKRAASETALQAAYEDAALKVVNNAGDNLLDKTTFDNLVAKVKGASVGVNRRGPMRSSLVDRGILAICHEMERKPKTGQVGKKKNGKTYISTPERIADYLKQWDALPL